MVNVSMMAIYNFGFSWYGWSAAAKIHWIMPVIGSAIFGFGKMKTTIILILNSKLIAAIHKAW